MLDSGRVQEFAMNRPAVLFGLDEDPAVITQRVREAIDK
jgi:hypothetical protein